MSHIKRITVLYTGAPGLPGTNTLYGHENGDTARDQVEAVGTFVGSLSTSLNTAITATVMGQVEIVESSTGQVVGIDATGDDIVVEMSDTATPLPFTTQLLVQIRTGVFNNGREIRGRLFIPGFCQDGNVGGAPDPDVVSGVAGAANTMLGHGFAVYSPTHKMWASVSAATVWNEWAVLRSRRD
jgi:hypothetical protein